MPVDYLGMAWIVHIANMYSIMANSGKFMESSL